MRILCGGPVSEDLPVFEAHIKGLQSQGFELDYKGIDGSPVPLPAPEGFKSVSWRIGTPSGDYKEKRVRWTYSRLENIAKLREEMRLTALEGGYDYLFMIDSDMIAAPGTLKTLIESDKDIVSGLTWTTSKFRRNHRFPNAWSLDNTRADFPPHVPPTPELLERIKAGGIHEVECAGGDYLISKRALGLTAFAHSKKIISEDINFALSARAAGIPIFLNCDVQIEHRRRR